MLLTEFDEEGFKEMMREEGREDILIQLVQEELISKEVAACKLNISVDELIEKMK